MNKITPQQGDATHDIRKGKPAQGTELANDITKVPQKQRSNNQHQQQQPQQPQQQPQQRQRQQGNQQQAPQMQNSGKQSQLSMMMQNKKTKTDLISAGVQALHLMAQQGINPQLRLATKMNITTNRLYSPIFKQILINNKGKQSKQIDVVIDELIAECRW